MEKVLFIVPHEDDELFVGGPLLINLARSENYEVFVFIATNGDSIPYENRCRINESIKVLATIGIPRDHMLFGGYGDSWDGVHIYNTEEDTVKPSHAGYKETYFPLKDGAEWHYLKTGEHSPYTKRAYREDIKSLLSTIRADVVICVDMDSNSDHRCLSLLTDAAMGELLKENPGYKPTYFKKYSYNGVLFGPSDYFRFPNAETKDSANSCFNPYFLWKNRIRYCVPDDCNTLLAKDNFLYKLAKIYKSQEVKINVGRFVNSDVVYWKRTTENLALHAEIETSSGMSSYLNDFLLLDSEDISIRECDYYDLCWHPQKEDTKPSVNIKLDKPCSIENILIYFNNKKDVLGNSIYISLYDEKDCLLMNPCVLDLWQGMYFEDVSVLNTENVKRVLIETDGKNNESIGISEIEIINGRISLPFSEFAFEEKDLGSENDYPKENAKKEAEKKWFSVKRKLYMAFDFYRLKRRIYNRLRKEKQDGK